MRPGMRSRLRSNRRPVRSGRGCLVRLDNPAEFLCTGRLGGHADRDRNESNIAFKENRLQIRQELQRSIGKFSALKFFKEPPSTSNSPAQRRFRNSGPDSLNCPSRVHRGKIGTAAMWALASPRASSSHGESSCGRGPRQAHRPAPLRSGTAAIATGYRIALPFFHEILFAFVLIRIDPAPHPRRLSHFRALEFGSGQP